MGIGNLYIDNDNSQTLFLDSIQMDITVVIGEILRNFSDSEMAHLICHRFSVLHFNYNGEIASNFCLKYWLGGPIIIRSTRLNCILMAFLAVQDSSIGDIVTHSLSE